MALPINTAALAMDLRSALTEINTQIEGVKNVATGGPENPNEVDVYRTQDGSGKFILAELLIAKSQLLTSLASLQTSSSPKRGR